MGKLLFLFTLMSFSLFGQEFAPIGAQWTFETIDVGGNNSLSKYTSIKDTIIGSETFRIVQKEYPTCNLYFSGNQYFMQRQDSIFWKHENYDSLQLLFDFGAEKGDTWFVPHSNFFANDLFETQYHLEVDSVYNTIFIPNVSIKTFDVSLYLADTDSTNIYVSHSRFYEYIGFEIALLPEHFDGICDGEHEYKFRCYSDSNIGEIKLLDESCLVNNNFEFNNYDLSLIPNPAINSFRIGNLDLKKVSLSIFSLSGQSIDFEISTNEINLVPVKSGIYFVQIQQGESTIIRKLIVL